MLMYSQSESEYALLSPNMQFSCLALPTCTHHHVIMAKKLCIRQHGPPVVSPSRGFGGRGSAEVIGPTPSQTPKETKNKNRRGLSR